MSKLEFWRSVKDSNKPEELNAYLSSYPNGQFKSLALSRLASLESGTPRTTDRRNTDQPGVDPATFSATRTSHGGPDRPRQGPAPRRAAPPQRARLRHQDDRQFNDKTRAVITRWQAARGYPSTGYLNKLQHKALLTEIVSTTQTADDSAARHRAAAAVEAAASSLSGRWWGRRGGGGGGGGGANPGAFMGGMIGGMMGGMMRR